MYMKNVKFLMLMLLAVLSLSSCENEEEEEKELLMSDILSSFDEGIEENTTNNDNSELPF